MSKFLRQSLVGLALLLALHSLVTGNAEIRSPEGLTSILALASVIRDMEDVKTK